MKKTMMIILLALIGAGGFAQEKKVDILFGGGVSEANITDADNGLAWGIISTIHTSEHWAAVVEGNNSSFNYSGGGKYKFALFNGGFKYKANRQNSYAGIRLTGGLLLGVMPDYFSYDAYYNLSQQITYDAGYGWNALIGFTYSIYLEKSHTVALSIDNALGYGQVSNNYIDIISNNGSSDIFAGTQKNNYLHYTGKLGLSILF